MASLLRSPTLALVLTGTLGALASCSAADAPRSDGDPSPATNASAAAMALPASARPVVATATPHTRVDGHAFPDKVIALTWDDGPDRNTLELAGYLKRHRIAATFFVVGSWIGGVSDDPGNGSGVYESGYAYLPVLGDLVGLGHRVANHTLNHTVLRESLGTAMLTAELRDNQRNIDPFLTNELRLFRAPGGGWGSFGQGIVDRDPYLTQLVGPVAWDIDRKDWEESLWCHGPSAVYECERSGPGGTLRMKASVVAARYVSSIESWGHGIVLLHDRVGHVGSTYQLDVAQAMIPALEAKGYVFAGPVLAFSPLSVREHDGEEQMSEARRWEPSSVRLGDVNGDGREDVCGRAAFGVTCAISIQTATSATDRMPRTTFRASRRVPDERAAALPAGSLHLADITGDGQADVCVASPDGIRCATSNAAGELGELRTWSQADHAASFRFADVDGDGKADACSRTAAGIACARNLGRRFDTARIWLADMTDAHGWAAPAYASTVQLADVDGDGRADVCGRGPKGIQCALSNGKGFGPLAQWSAASIASTAGHAAGVATPSDFGDDAGWGKDPALYGSLRFADLNGDGRDDVCGLGAAGLVCALSTGRGFTRATVWIDRRATDAQGWASADLAATLQLGDINGDGRADVCGRGRDGLVCGLAP